MKTLLIVEDDYVSCELLKIILKEFKFDTADNGKDAIELFLKNKYNAILMDLKMPIMDGITATKIIREHEKENNLSKTPIFAITATNYKSSYELFDDFILKPFNSKELIRKIKKT